MVASYHYIVDGKLAHLDKIKPRKKSLPEGGIHLFGMEIFRKSLVISIYVLLLTSTMAANIYKGNRTQDLLDSACSHPVGVGDECKNSECCPPKTECEYPFEYACFSNSCMTHVMFIMYYYL